MANTYICCPHILLLLIGFISLSNPVQARFLEIQHPMRGNRTVKFLAVGDWGRKGAFNQSLVARRHHPIRDRWTYKLEFSGEHIIISMGEVGAKLRIDLVISTGDNFYKDGLTGVNDSAFTQSFTKIYTARSLHKPWYAIMGNHDYHGNTEAQMSPLLKRRDWRWNCHRSYIVRAGMLDIFLIDTNPFVNKYFLERPKNKFNWKGVLPRDKYLSTLLLNLKTALNTSKATWKIVVGHHPIRSIGQRGDTQELLKQLLPILEAHRVPIYINGHDHCLEHISNTGVPIEFVTSGGGSRAWNNNFQYDRYKQNLKFYYDGQGFVSVQVSRIQANVAFYDVYGKILHSFMLKKHANKY